MIIGLIRRILSFSGKYKKRIEAAFILAVIESILSKLPICYAFFVLSKFYDKSLIAMDCAYVGIALVITIIFQMFIHNFVDRLQSAAGYMIFANKRMELGDHLRKLPMGYYTEGNIGKISSVLSTDMIFIEEVAMSTIANMMSYVLSAIILVIFMFFLDWRLGVIAGVTSISATLLASKMNKVSLKQASIRQNQNEHLTDAVISFIEGIGVIKSYNLLGDKSVELCENFSKTKEKSLEFEEKMTPWIIALNIVYAIGIALILGGAIILQRKNLMSLPYLLGVILFVFDIFGPLKALYGESARLTVMNSCLDRIEEVLKEPELEDKGRNMISKKSENDVEVAFENVSFAYNENKVLKNISFEMKKNTITALVGPSGGGKSTIANILARFWDVQDGKIFVKGEDIRNISIETLMNQISMVFQRIYLFQDTIYNNILMGNLDASEEEVYEAAKKARCYDFIMKLPKGFQTMVGEGGTTLSGGEKQRISIARCILKDAPIVILDEATASVDSDNESYIQEAISELVQGKTLLVIAHRLNTIKHADQILVVSEGNIVEKGVHEKLLEKEHGVYKSLYNATERKYNWNI